MNQNNYHKLNSIFDFSHFSNLVITYRNILKYKFTQIKIKVIRATRTLYLLVSIKVQISSLILQILFICLIIYSLLFRFRLIFLFYSVYLYSIFSLIIFESLHYEGAAIKKFPKLKKFQVTKHKNKQVGGSLCSLWPKGGSAPGQGDPF